MKTLSSFAVFALLGCGAVACESAKPNDDVAGGQTADFTGDADIAECETQSEERPGDPPRLGFSVSQILASAAGVFEIPIRWEDGCDTPEGEAASLCQSADARFRELGGVETSLRVEIVPTGAPAQVHHPTLAQPACAQWMLIPVTAHITTSDGLLEETLELNLGTECGRSAGIGFHGPPGELAGTLSDPSWGLTNEMRADFSAELVENDMWLDFYIEAPWSRALGIDLPPFGDNNRRVPRTAVEQQPGSPMPSGHCGHINY